MVLARTNGFISTESKSVSTAPQVSFDKSWAELTDPWAIYSKRLSSTMLRIGDLPDHRGDVYCFWPLYLPTCLHTTMHSHIPSHMQQAYIDTHPFPCPCSPPDTFAYSTTHMGASLLLCAIANMPACPQRSLYDVRHNKGLTMSWERGTSTCGTPYGARATAARSSACEFAPEGDLGCETNAQKTEDMPPDWLDA